MTAEAASLSWRGAETIADAKGAIADRADIALNLPADFHHAVCVHLMPPAQGPRPAAVKIEGGAELLARLAEIHGLESIAELEAPVAQAHARVCVLSPSPTVLIVCRRGGTPEPASP